MSIYSVKYDFSLVINILEEENVTIHISIVSIKISIL